VAHQQSLLYTPSREIAPIYELTLEERECLRTLYPGNYKRYKDRNPKRVDGTCRWVLDHRLYDEWLQIHQSTLLWISADPGCGKSVLAKALVDQDLTIPDDASLLYFFFKDDNADQKSSAKAMAALLHQLFSRPQRSFLIRHAMPDYRSIGQSIVDSFSSLWEIFALAANDPRAGPIYCVLDALDECVIEDRRELLATLEGAFNEPENSELGGNVKFLVTSRPYQDIERQFYFLIRLEGEKETNIIKKEIDRVIKHKVPELSKRLRLDQHQESLLETKLLSVEHRTYLWLHLVLENLVQSNNFNRTKFDKIIEDLPRSVEAAYEKILAKGEKSEQKKLLELLQLVIAATRPLSVAELNLALPLRLDDSRSLKEFVDEELESDDQFKTTMRNWCGLFLTVVDDLVYLLHQTAREFLVVKECEKVTVSTRWKHSIKFWEAEILMTQKCVAYLLFPDFNDSSTDLELKALKDGRRGFGFFKYAANTWGHHFREIQAHEEAADLGRATLKLYDVKSRRFKTWTDFCNDKVFSSPNTASSSLPLMLATNLGHHTLIQYLLQAEHDLEATEGDEKHTPFLRAVSRGDLATSKALAQLGANIEVRDLNGQTALILSSKDRNGIEMLQWLVGRKPNLEAKDRFRKSALQYALERNSEEAIMCLLDAGADKESNDEHSRSILSKVAESNLSEAVRILLSLGADSCSEDIFGQTPLMWAAQCKNDATEIIELLILHGSDLNKRDKLGRTPLHWAASSGTNLSLSNIKTLLRHNAAINAGDDKGSTPLSIVVNSPYIMNRLEIMRLLVVEKADINARDESGRTPLCSVLRRVSLFGHQEKDAEEVIRELLNSGAELDIMDGTGRTPLFWALEGGPSCLKFAETLLDFGANEGSGVLQGHSIEHWAGNRSSPINKEGRMEPIVEEIPLVAETDLRATPFEVSA
jgi:ankyrin repeat protein